MSARQHSSGIRWWYGLVFFVVVFLVVQVALSVFIIVAGALGLFGPEGTDVMQSLLTPLGLSLQVLITGALLLGFAIALPKWFGVAPTYWLRLRSTSPSVFALAITGVAGLGFVVDQVLFYLHAAMPSLLDTHSLNLLNQAFAAASPAAFVGMTLVISIGPGVAEELFFRGFVLRSFQARMPAWVAVLLSSILFGVMHWDGLQGLGAVLIGIFLGYITIKIGSIWPAVVAHAFNNLLCALFARYAENPTEQTFSHGHPPELWITSLIITVVSLYGIARVGSKER